MNLHSPIAIPPDPIRGPRSIGTSTDHVKVDPDNARIQYAGLARPTRRLFGTAFTNNASKSVSANGAHEWGFRDDSISSVWWSFGPLPDWVDVSADITLRAAVYVGAALSAPNDVVRLVGKLQFQRVGAVPSADSGTTVDYGFDGGSGYTASTVEVLTLRTVGGGTFQPGDLITVQIQRNGAATEDTVTPDLIVCDSPWIEVKQKEVA